MLSLEERGVLDRAFDARMRSGPTDEQIRVLELSTKTAQAQHTARTRVVLAKNKADEAEEIAEARRQLARCREGYRGLRKSVHALQDEMTTTYSRVALSRLIKLTFGNGVFNTLDYYQRRAQGCLKPSALATASWMAMYAKFRRSLVRASSAANEVWTILRDAVSALDRHGGQIRLVVQARKRALVKKDKEAFRKRAVGE